MRQIHLSLPGALVAMFMAFAFSSCNKDDTYVVDYQYEYAPVDSGHYVIYDVDSITYTYLDPVPFRDSAHYQLKEEVGDTFYDSTNELAYELNLYRRENASSPWVYDRKWYVKRSGVSFQKTEGDNKFVKLVFPPSLSTRWNGNVFLSTDNNFKVFLDWDYHYAGVNEPFSINGFAFDSTLTVSEVSDTMNLVQRRIRKEVYAKGVGMIYQEWEVLDKQNITGNWQTGNLDGFRIRMRVIDHN